MKPKIICIGANKTGTTSLMAFFRMHGFRIGDQAKGELLMSDYAKGRWDRIIALIESADFFQDLPFSARHTYRYITPAYPDARFILTIRRNAEEWYQSLVRFHAGKWGDGHNAPTARQLQAATYRYPGFAWDANRALYNSPPDDPYHKETLLQWYNDHIREVQAFFAPQPQRLLQIEISDPEAAPKIAIFAGFEPMIHTLPHLNKWPG